MSVRPAIDYHKPVNTVDRITGTVERIVFRNPENGWTAVRFTVEGMPDLQTVVGIFTTINPGEFLELTGNWQIDKKFGRQFVVSSYHLRLPATVVGIEKYLGSGLIRGVGKKRARLIVDHFGEASIDIIEHEPHSLKEIRGIGQKIVDKITESWEEHRAINNVMLFLQSHGISPLFAVRIFKAYGNDAVNVVKEQPYRLAAEIHGIGFVSADKIARSLGVAPDSEKRLQAGISYTLFRESESGHCFIPRDQLCSAAAKLLGVEDIGKIDAAIEAEIAAERLISERRFSRPDQVKIDIKGVEARIADPAHAVYLPPFYYAERGLARKIREMLVGSPPPEVDPDRVKNWIDRFCQKEQFELSDDQREAVYRAVSSRVSVVTGGPGTGKTTALRTLVKLLRAMSKSLLLASPTGKAATRLAEVTGTEAATIHRMLEFKPELGRFKHDDEHPLKADVVIVDEASMLDVILANSLAKAVSESSQLILVGDVDQLPSVGPGLVLRDLIESRVVPVTRLTKIFRQALESKIVTNAHRVNAGRSPEMEVAPFDANSGRVKLSSAKSDFIFVEVQDPEVAAHVVVDMASKFLPDTFGYDPMKDIQVLSPGNKSDVGTQRLNEILQQRVNPRSPRKAELLRGRMYREGDRVLQIRNSYKTQVMNGEGGIIREINTEDQVVRIEVSGRVIDYDYSDLLDLVHGFAISVHKSQGSEYPCVIMPILETHYPLLSRALLYTGITRAKQRCVLVGTRKAVGIAVSSVQTRSRYTQLDRRLTGEIDDRPSPNSQQASVSDGTPGGATRSIPGLH